MFCGVLRTCCTGMVSHIGTVMSVQALTPPETGAESQQLKLLFQSLKLALSLYIFPTRSQNYKAEFCQNPAEQQCSVWDYLPPSRALFFNATLLCHLVNSQYCILIETPHRALCALNFLKWTKSDYLVKICKCSENEIQPLVILLSFEEIATTLCLYDF